MSINKLLKLADKFSEIVKKGSGVEDDMFDLMRQMKAEGYRDEDIVGMVQEMLVSLRVHSLRGLQIQHPRESTRTTDLTDLIPSRDDRPTIRTRDDKPTDVTDLGDML